MLLLAGACGDDVSEDGIAAREALGERIEGEPAAEAADATASTPVADGCPISDAASFAEIQDELGDAEVGQLQSTVEPALDDELPIRVACAFDLDLDLEFEFDSSGSGDRRVFVWAGDLRSDQDLETFLSQSTEMEDNLAREGDVAAGCAPPGEEEFCVAVTVNRGFLIAAGLVGPGADEPGARAALDRFRPLVYRSLLG